MPDEQDAVSKPIYGEFSDDEHTSCPAGPDLAASDWPDVLSEIIRCGVMAPSAHNTQPWSFSWHEDLLHCSVVSKTLPVLDPCDHAAMMSMGAVVENIRLAAAAFGFDIQIARPGIDSICAIRFVSGTPAIDHWRRSPMEYVAKGLMRPALQRVDLAAFCDTLARGSERSEGAGQRHCDVGRRCCVVMVQGFRLGGRHEFQVRTVMRPGRRTRRPRLYRDPRTGRTLRGCTGQHNGQSGGGIPGPSSRSARVPCRHIR